MNIIIMILFFVLGISNRDVIQHHLFISLSLIFSLNTIRLGGGKNLNINHIHEKKQDFKLIEGEFWPQDATEVLINMSPLAGGKLFVSKHFTLIICKH